MSDSLPRLDPFAAAFIADPYQPGRLYQEADPVHWGLAANPRLDGAWYLTRFGDVSQALGDSRLGREARRARDDGVGAPAPPALRAFSALLEHWMVFRDPPAHQRLRGPVARAFTPRVAGSLRPAIAALASQLLDGLLDRGAADIVETFALPLPVLVIAQLLGVDGSDLPRFRRWSLALLRASASRHPPSTQAYADAETAARALAEYFRSLAAARRATPRADLVSQLAAVDGERLSEDEMVATCTHLLTAGHETTVNLIAKGVLGLCRNPEVTSALLRRPELMPQAVEELLRYDSPVQLVTRWAMEDLVIGGSQIRRGDSVGLLLGIANRDPRRFARPDVLDPERADGGHVSFGSGIHACLGAALARAEAEIALGLILEQMPRLRLAHEPIKWRDSLVFHGPEALRVAWG